MSNLYAAQNTYINNVTTLTPVQFGDKVDLFYDAVIADDRVLALNVSSDSNVDMDVHVIAEVPDGVEPQHYFTSVIDRIVKKALAGASLNVTAQVAARIPQLQH